MRILIVTHYFWPENSRINGIAQDLVGRGHVVTVLTGKPNYPGGRVFAEYSKAPRAFSTYCGTEIVRVPLVPRGRTKFSLALNYITFAFSGVTIGALRLAGRSFDAILMFQPSPITSALPALLQRSLKRAPLALWVLDLWPETLSAMIGLRWRWALSALDWLVSFIYQHCDRILVQSRAFVASVESHGGRTENIFYLPSWAESAFETMGVSTSVAPELAPFRNTFNVIFTGNIGEAQDMPTVLAAANALRHRRDIRWLIVGDGSAANGVRSEIAAKGLDDRVIMLGRHPIEKIPGFFAGADALLVSLRADPVFRMTIPGKLQDYLCSGKPVVAALDGEGAKIIAEAGAGLVSSSGDAAGLASIVSRLADMAPEERARMGAAGRDYWRREFDRATLFGRLEGWLLEMTGRGRLANLDT